MQYLAPSGSKKECFRDTTSAERERQFDQFIRAKGGVKIYRVNGVIYAIMVVRERHMNVSEEKGRETSDGLCEKTNAVKTKSVVRYRGVRQEYRTNDEYGVETRVNV